MVPTMVPTNSPTMKPTSSPVKQPTPIQGPTSRECPQSCIDSCRCRGSRSQCLCTASSCDFNWDVCHPFGDPLKCGREQTTCLPPTASPTKSPVTRMCPQSCIDSCRCRGSGNRCLCTASSCDFNWDVCHVFGDPLKCGRDEATCLSPTSSPTKNPAVRVCPQSCIDSCRCRGSINQCLCTASSCDFNWDVCHVFGDPLKCGQEEVNCLSPATPSTP
jgi:hypothetical protein